jgi:DsbC/DsbD-like thiol-disulfide interchange protein
MDRLRWLWAHRRFTIAIIITELGSISVRCIVERARNDARSGRTVVFQQPAELMSLSLADWANFWRRTGSALLAIWLGYSPLCGAAGAQSEPAATDDLVHARLVAETAGAQPGSTLWVAVELTMKSGWHTYWRNPGDSGMATRVEWMLPPGASASPVLWPWPERFVASGLGTYGYEGRVALLAAVKLPARPASERVEVGAAVSWLACSKICVPGSKTVGLALPVRAAPPALDPATAALFMETRRRLPQPAPFESSFTLDDEQIRLLLPRAAFAELSQPRAEFYPFDSSLIAHGAPQALRIDERHIELLVRRSSITQNQLDIVNGLLVVAGNVNKADASRAYNVTARRVAPARHSTVTPLLELSWIEASALGGL